MKDILGRPELEQREAITDMVGRWFLAEDFAAIEDFLGQVQREELRTPSGLWILGLAENGVSQFAHGDKLKNPKQWEELEARIQRWIEAFPQSPAARVAMATTMLNRAWVYRGSGYANTVSEKQFSEFHAQIAKGKNYLLENWNLAALDPNGYLQLLVAKRVEKNGKIADFEQTFAEATRKFPEYLPLYFEAMTNYLPKWQGSVEDLERFARKVMNSRDTRSGRMLYARIYWFASGSQYKDKLFLQTKVHWGNMRAGFEVVVEDYPDQWNINNFAKFACMAKDKPTTTRAFSMIKGNPVNDAWFSPEQFERCRKFAARRAPSHSPESSDG